jgi:itaconyl-CoA hydratase
MSITRAINYFEDFEVGDKITHQRGRTVMETDNVMFTQLGLNTAEGHFNEDMMNKIRIGSWGGKRVMVGSFTIGLTIGLAAEDISENALAELSLDKIRLATPVYHGDTIYAESEVLGKEETDLFKGAGIVHFKVTGKNQEGKPVFEGEKKTVIKKRVYYLKDDEKFWPRK